jgi:hypothetical protein
MMFAQHLFQAGAVKGVAGGLGHEQRACRLVSSGSKAKPSLPLPDRRLRMLNEDNGIRGVYQAVNLRRAALALNTRRRENAVLHIHYHHYPFRRHRLLPPMFSQTNIIRARRRKPISESKKFLRQVTFFLHSRY